MDYNTRSPLAKGVGDHFEDHIVGAIYIRVEAPTRSRLEQSSLESFPHIPLLMGQRLMVEETALAGVRLLSHDDLDADQLGLVDQHLDEAGMGQEDEGLVIPLAEVDFLLPAIILPDDEGTDLTLDEMLDDTPTGDMQVALHLAFPFVGEDIETA